MRTSDLKLSGSAGNLVVRRWGPDRPAVRVGLLCHGYAGPSARYEPVAARLVADGAAVYAPDHQGHGRSDGDRVSIADMEAVVDDVDLVAAAARAEHPHIPVAVV